jgi:autotransporter-associated beta strand protein
MLRWRTAAIALSLSLLGPLAQAADVLLVGTGGVGGGDGGAGTIRGGNGGADFYLPGSGGAGGVPVPTQTITSPANGNGLLAIYDYVGIGGGAGGGDGGNLGGITGSNGGVGVLGLNGTALNVTSTLLIGGAGGGGGSGGAGFTRGGNGGTGGSGTLTATGGAVITVGGQVYIGGLGGTGGNCGCSGNGGAGGAGILNLGDASTLSLTGANLAINGNGMLNIGNATPNGATAGTITGLAGSIANAGTINFNQSDAAYTFSTAIAGTGQVVQNSSGTTFLTGANSYSGGTTINAGLIDFVNGGSLGTGNVTLNGGGLQWATGNTTDISGRLNALGASGGTLDTNGNNVTLANGLSGTGGLTKTGSGTLTATSMNTYTGGTTITGGTLALGAGGGLIPTGAVNLANAGAAFDISAGGAQTIGALFGAAGSNVNLGGNTLTVNHTGNSTFGGVISGSGGVTFAGTGTQTFTGLNAYTGSTTIGSGTLALTGFGSIATSSGLVDNGTFDISGTTAGASIAALSGSGTVALGNQMLTLSGAGGTYSGGIGGTGILAFAGGTQTLSGASTYSGGTNLKGGTLIVGNNAALGTGALNIGGQVALDSAANVVLGNAIDFGTGTTLTIGGSNALGLSGVVSGAGNLVKSGAAVTTLSGANTYTGSTTVNGGTLALSGAGRLAAATSVALASAGATLDLSAGSSQSVAHLSGVSRSQVTLGANTLTLTDNTSQTFGGSLTGSGGLVKQGSGTLTLNGTSSAFTGVTTVSAGTLAVGDAANVSAVLGGNVLVDTQGTLRGHGAVNGDVVSDGTVWPGGSVGMLTINGNYTQNADATLQIDVTPGEASQLLVHGSATLGGTLSLIYAPGTYTATTYTLVQADTLTGKFASTMSSGVVPTTLSPTVTYTPTQANLVLTSPTPADPTIPTTPPTVVRPQDGGFYASVMQVANLIGQQSMTTVLDATLRPADMSCGNGGSAHANAVTPSCSNGLWTQYSGSSTDLTGNNGLNSTAFGLQGGADMATGEFMHVGVEAGLDRINSNDHNGSYGHVDNVHGGIYAFAYAGPLVISGMVDEAHGSYRLYRQTGIGHASANPDGDTTAAALQVAWPISAAQWEVTPTVGALYQHQRLDGFNERVISTSPLASAFTLRGRDSTYTTMQPYASVSFTRPFVTGGVSYVPQFELGYRYDARNSNGAVVNTLSQDGTPFALRSDAMGRSMTTVGARVTAQAGASWNLYLDYQGQFASHLNDNALSVGFTKMF